MIVCIDTNALLPVLGTRHPYGVILDAFIDGAFTWAVSNEIMAEYEEVVGPRIGARRWEDFIRLIEGVGGLRQNLKRVSPTFRFDLISDDVDDNKFADCAIVAEADFIITDDRHFAAMANSGYKPQPISPAKFIEQCLSGQE